VHKYDHLCYYLLHLEQQYHTIKGRRVHDVKDMNSNTICIIDGVNELPKIIQAEIF